MRGVSDEAVPDVGSGAVSGLVSLGPGLGDTAVACSLDFPPLGRRGLAARGVGVWLPLRASARSPHRRFGSVLSEPHVAAPGPTDSSH